MMKHITADQARRLSQDETFIALCDKLKAEQADIFLNSLRDDTDVREEAHTILRAIRKIEQALKSVVTEEAMNEKRKLKQ